MYKILSKYNFITILPFEDTFYYVAPLLKKINFSKELLRLNYVKYAPYKNPNIVSLTQNSSLMLWFYKVSIDTTVIVPESYLAYKELRTRQEDALYVIHDTSIKILIIKDSKLLSAFTLDAIDNNTIALSMDEYQVSLRVDIEKLEYEGLKERALNSLSIQEFYKFNQLDLDKRSIFKKFVDKASYPVSAMIIFAVLVSYIQSSVLKSQINDLTQEYIQKKDKNKEIKKFIKEHNHQVKKWKVFIDEELVYVEPIAILDSLYNIFEESEKANLVDVSLSENKMNVKIQTDMNPVIFLNRLNEVKYFSRVIIENTHKQRNKTKIISYDIDVKMLKEI